VAHCFFIGVGGTGAKCAEAVIHLCAAGLGPDHCSMMLVDQDEPNGNGVRCQQILGSYLDLRRRLTEPSERPRGAGSALFQTEISIPAGSPLWCPTTGRGDTLGRISGYDLLEPDQKALTDCLFLHKERDQTLGQGFRAHPSVGAAVLLAKTRTAEPFWQTTFASIDEARRGQEVKIFLLGSIFGGTGAAGFPTIARLIRRAIREKTGNAVQIGGALMLPYFSFPPPRRDSDELLPDSSVFLEQTQGALRYYHRLLTEDKLFDNVYLIGWDPLLEIKGYAQGGAEQRNPALVPEIFAGLAGMRFFAGSDAEPVIDLERSDDGHVTWRDLPEIHPAAEGEVRKNFGTLIRLACAFHSVYRPALGPERWRTVQHEAWFRRLLDRDGTLLAQPASHAMLDDADAYCQQLLLWAANVAFSGAGNNKDVRLYKASQFARPVEAKFDRAALRTDIDRGAFGELIDGEEGPDLPLIFDRLTYDRLGSNRSGIAPFLHALHEACRNSYT
jgi:Tubulin like